MKRKKREFETHIIQKEVDLSGVWESVANQIKRGKRGNEKKNYKEN